MANNKLVCPICGKPTKYYKGKPHKDLLCAEHAKEKRKAKVINKCVRKIKNSGEDLKLDNLTIDQLAEGYCKAVESGDEHLKDLYAASLMMRFYNKISKNKQSTAIDMETIYKDWFMDAMDYALQCQKIDKESEKNDSKDDKNVNQIDETTIKTIKKQRK